MDSYLLPDLPYAYDSLEPWCDATTLQLHHTKHHQSYVDGANAAVEALTSIDPDDAMKLHGARSALTFNLGGHVLHSLFWENLAPTSATSSAPSAALAERVQRDLGGPERFRKLFVATCKGVQDSGWGALVHDAIADRLVVTGLHDHHNDLVPDTTILAVVDVWEHAYYLTHRNDRVAWVEAAFDHLDWNTVSARLEAATAAAGGST